MPRWYQRKTTKGKLNELTDRLWHPLAKKTKLAYIADFAQHTLIERNPKGSIKKALRYYPKRLLRRK